jgi:hypothetical protein
MNLKKIFIGIATLWEYMKTFPAVILYFSIFLLLLEGVHAQDCNEITLELREVTSEAFNEYPQLNDVKQDILLLFYSRERGTCPEDLYSLGVLSKSFIEKFDTAYRLSRSADPEDNQKAVELAGELKLDTETFAARAAPFGVEAEDLANSARQATSAFLTNLGNQYAREGDKTDETRAMISYYRQAALAFSLAGSELEAASYRIKMESLEKVYSRDMERADGLFSEAEAKYDRAMPLLKGGFFSRVTAYTLLRESQIMVEGALEIYQHHNEKEKAERSRAALEVLQKTKRFLVYQIVIYFAVIGGVITAMAFYVISVLKTWKNDSLDYSLGNELVQVRSGEEY